MREEPSNPDAERLVSSKPLDDDSQFELKLRPNRLAEFIGQTKAKEQLAHRASKPPNPAAKPSTTCSSSARPASAKPPSPPSSPTSLASAFSKPAAPRSDPGRPHRHPLQHQGSPGPLPRRIHRLQPVLQEKLYTALEDYRLDIMIGSGPAARTFELQIKPFTFVAATTRPGLLSSPMRSTLRHPHPPGVLHR